MPAHRSPIGSMGRVSRHGAIRPGRTGEVLISVEGRLEAFLARDADGGAIAAGEEVVVVERLTPRGVLVTRLPGADPAQPEEPT